MTSPKDTDIHFVDSNVNTNALKKKAIKLAESFVTYRKKLQEVSELALTEVEAEALTLEKIPTSEGINNIQGHLNVLEAIARICYYLRAANKKSNIKLSDLPAGTSNTLTSTLHAFGKCVGKNAIRGTALRDYKAPEVHNA